MKLLRVASLFLVISFSGFASAAFAATGVSWSSTSAGTIGSNVFTLSGLNSPSLYVLDLSSSDYSGAPLSSSESSIEYTGSSNWTVTTSSTGDLLLYVIYWRNESADYVFDQPFDFISGMSGASQPSSGTLHVTNSFTSGIIRFNAVSSVSLTISSLDSSYQALDFATGSLASVPEPATYGAFAGLIVLSISFLRRRRFLK